MGRAPCCDKANVKRGPWSPEEDELLKSYIENHGTGGNWISLPLKAGLRRCGKSCRLRWLNYLRPDIKHGKFTEEEDRVIFSLYKEIGSRWSIIAAKLNGRTDNDVKNHWNTKLKKLLIMKKHDTLTSNADQESYSFSEFQNAKTETHQESLATMTNLFQGFSGYGSSLSFHHHEPAGHMVGTGVHAPGYASKTTISPSSVDSELSNGTSSMIVGNFSWTDHGRGSGADDNGFLIDMLSYGEGMENGCHLFQSSLETGDQKISGVDELGYVAVPTFPAMLSDYIDPSYCQLIED